MKFDVILADPPWKFDYWIPGQGKKKGSRAAEAHYTVMDTESICALPVANLGKDNSILFLWGVWPRLKDIFDVMAAWNYEYKTIGFVWVKANKGGFGHFMGMGYYTRANTEPCFIGVRGSMPVAVHDVLQIIYSAVRGHSQKPDGQYSKIERLYPNMKYCELFARRKREGWLSWGNEVESDIDLLESSVASQDES
jgi:N6-adenosine-specific RNA methylase IME4